MPAPTGWLYYSFVGVTFAVAVFGATWTLKRLKPKPHLWGFSLLVLMVAAIALLGLVKGWIAMLVAGVLSSDRVTRWVDCRRFGKRVSRALGLSPNLFFTALELAIGTGNSVAMLAQMGREGADVDTVKKTLVLPVMQGLAVLEQRYGLQRNVIEARLKLMPLVEELFPDGVTSQ